MNQATYNSLKSFIWAIANECLVDVYDVGDYRKIILPMIVIRRFDAILEASKKFNGDNAAATSTNTNQNFKNYSKFTLKSLQARTDKQTLQKDFEDYLNGFSPDVQKIISNFHFRDQISRLIETDRLGLLIEKFCDERINLSNTPVLNDDGTEKIEALDNHSMGTLFEEVIRMFNEQTNVTDAGRHFTPRDIIKLMADLAFIPIQDKILNTTYRIYDGACGTGGMLTVAEERIIELAKKYGKKVSILLYGQEIADETYAIACADMLIKGEDIYNLIHGSTISDDKLKGETFDFMLSNPPFGTSWKAELSAFGGIKKEEITDARFLIEYDGNPEFSLVPDIGDPQMLFLANNLSKMKTTLRSRIIEVHNGSSLFTGAAGSGSSNLRRYIIENDMLEAIVALPEKMFYNTGIGTYIWIVTNQKDERRKGTVQLIDATSFKVTLRKNIGEKNCEITDEVRQQILKLLTDYKDADQNFSRVFRNEEFGFYSVDILRPLRLRVNLDENIFPAINDAALVAALKKYKNLFGDKFSLNYNSFIAELAKLVTLNKKRLKVLRDNLTAIDENAAPVQKADGTFEPDNNLKDTEQIPLTYEGGIDNFFECEIKPFVPDSWIDSNSVVIGYEITFTKYFYQPAILRTPKVIISDLQNTEKTTANLLADIVEDFL